MCARKVVFFLYRRAYTGAKRCFAMDTIVVIALYAGLLLLIYFAGTHLEPYKPAWKALERGLLGVGLLLVWNLLAAPFELTIGLNPVTALVAGALGAPGLGLLLVLRLM